MPSALTTMERGELTSIRAPTPFPKPEPLTEPARAIPDEAINWTRPPSAGFGDATLELKNVLAWRILTSFFAASTEGEERIKLLASDESPDAPSIALKTIPESMMDPSGRVTGEPGEPAPEALRR